MKLMVISRVLWALILAFYNTQQIAAFSPPQEGCCRGAPAVLTDTRRRKYLESFYFLSNKSRWSPSYRRGVAFLSSSLKKDESSSSFAAQQALERTKRHLEKLKQRQKRQRSSTSSVDPVDELDNDADSYSPPPDPLGEEREDLKSNYLLQSANSLKEELKRRKLPKRGNKPTLAARLAEHDIFLKYGTTGSDEGEEDDLDVHKEEDDEGVEFDGLEASPSSFAGISSLSPLAKKALSRAGFLKQGPTPIQASAISKIVQGESIILHAETGSGKTLAYLLPITERIYNDFDDDSSLAVILTPTRELAAQVAGVAQALVPDGKNKVRLVTHPSNLMTDNLRRQRGEVDAGEDVGRGGVLDDRPAGRKLPRLYVGSAKVIQYSLYGDGGRVLPAPPTPKPKAMEFLQKVRYVVLDEVDRMLDVKRSKADKLSKKKFTHEKPAAIVTAAIMRQSLGQAQVVAASATVGRSLRREFSRVLGLPPQECPPVVRGKDYSASDDQDLDEDEEREEPMQVKGVHVGRAVTIPSTVDNYVLPVAATSPGKLLTAAYGVIQSLQSTTSSKTNGRRILLVLTRGFGINTQNAIGALKHFDCKPEPMSLLDALEAEGTDRMIEKHRQISGAYGVGESTTSYFEPSTMPQSVSAGDEGEKPNSESEYLLVTGEDTIRGLHFDGLDVVIVVGRANGPDEYTHIAGRTGRAGRTGKVINIVSEENAAALKSWERMLDSTFTEISGPVATIFDDIGEDKS